MKVYFKDLKLETTLEDVCSAFECEKDDAIEALSADGYYEVDDMWGGVFGSMSKNSDSETIDFEIESHDFDIIDWINCLDAAKDNPFLMIVKDEVMCVTPECKTCNGEGYMDEEIERECKECEGTGGNEEMKFIQFEAIEGNNPPPLKGGEYDKNFILSEKELEQYNEMDTILYSCEITDVKYQEFFFEREKNYKPEKWAKLWIENYG